MSFSARCSMGCREFRLREDSSRFLAKETTRMFAVDEAITLCVVDKA